METLPTELIEKVSGYLSPQDLARCCAVSRIWREIFNQDWLWVQHCDTALEEPLRITPSVVEPAFVTPQVEDSTLTPIGEWRLAYMREQHLWRNWKRTIFREEYLPLLEKEIHRSFLGNSLLVIWCSDRFEIWDMSVIPVASVVKVCLPPNPNGRWDPYKFIVLDNSMLLVVQECLVKVFVIDTLNKSLKVTYEIDFSKELKWLPLHFVGKHHISTNTTTFFGVSACKLNLAVFDLENGNKITEESCPFTNDTNEAEISRVIVSSKSEDVLVVIESEDDIIYYVYSLENQLFLPDPITKALNYGDYDNTETINKHYVALGALPSLIIVDYHSSKVLFENEGQENDIRPEAYDDSFIFLDPRGGKMLLRQFCLKSRTIFTFFQYEPFHPDWRHACELTTVNDKYVILLDMPDKGRVMAVAVFEPSGYSLKQVNIVIPQHYDNVNNTFTRGIHTDLFGKRVFISYYW